MSQKVETPIERYPQQNKAVDTFDRELPLVVLGEMVIMPI